MSKYEERVELLISGYMKLTLYSIVDVVKNIIILYYGVEYSIKKVKLIKKNIITNIESRSGFGFCINNNIAYIVGGYCNQDLSKP